MPYLKQHSHMTGIADAFLRDAELYGPLLEYITHVMTRESEVSKTQREMIAAHVSRLNGCEFCVGIHKDTLRAMGVAETTIDQLGRGEPLTSDPHLSPVLQFAEQLTTIPSTVSETEIQSLHHHGWSEQAIEDIVNVVALFGAVNRLVDAFGFRGNEVYFERIGGMLSGDGYRQLVNLARRGKQSA